jgi:hypothetical protein
MPRTHAGRWQWQAAASAVCVAVLLIVSRSYRLWHLVSTRPPGFYDHCCLDLEMWETKAFNAINLPALILAAPVRMLWDRPLYTGVGFGLLTSDIENILAIWVFWWWIGKQFDQGWRPAGAVDRALYDILAFFGILMVVAGVEILITTRGLDSFALNISVSMAIWGILFSGSLFYRIRWLKSHLAG